MHFLSSPAFIVPVIVLIVIGAAVLLGVRMDKFND